jgi:hypothetical protein
METPEILKMSEMAEILSKWQKWQKSSQNGILMGHHQTSSARNLADFTPSLTESTTSATHEY